MFSQGNMFVKSNGAYHVYVLVPDHLRIIFKPDRITQTLKTKDPKQAKLNLGNLVARIHDKFRTAETIARNPKSLALLEEAKSLGMNITKLPETRQDCDNFLVDLERCRVKRDA